MKEITSIEETKRLLEKNYNYYTFPVLGITIKHRRPDVLKLAFNQSLPEVMADMVIGAYKAKMEGREPDLPEKLEATDEFLHDLHDKGYVLLSSLCVSHKIMDVPQSDLDNLLISWQDIPEEDAMGFIMHLISSAQTAETSAGGTVSVEEATSFPKPRRSQKRTAARANR